MNDTKYEYGNTWGRLLTETALIAFYKKNGDVRLMLGTRNADTARIMWQDKHLKGLLDGFDHRCNIKNGNIGVIDLAIGDCRSFGVNNIIAIQWLGEITTSSGIEEAIKRYEELEKEMVQDTGHTVSGGKAVKVDENGNAKDEFSGIITF